MCQSLTVVHNIITEYEFCLKMVQKKIIKQIIFNANIELFTYI